MKTHGRSLTTNRPVEALNLFTAAPRATACGAI
jgi:hypothetical protein